MKDKFRSALWLLKSVDQRQKTIIKVATSIINFQHAFLDQGIEHLRPLVLRDVANDIGMHESTVSRVVNNKYMHTPQGVYEMKYFFHSGINSSFGESVSSVTIKQRIKKIIEGEDPAPAAQRLEDHEHPAEGRAGARPAHHRQVPRGAPHPHVQPAQGAVLDRREPDVSAGVTVGALLGARGAPAGLNLDLLAGAAGLDRRITLPHVQKTGLALAGYDEYLRAGRVLIFGESEIRFLEQLDAAGARRRTCAGCSRATFPCVLMTMGLDGPAELAGRSRARRRAAAAHGAGRRPSRSPGSRRSSKTRWRRAKSGTACSWTSWAWAC